MVQPDGRELGGAERAHEAEEFSGARLKKVIDQTAPVMRNAAIDRLVHLNPDLPGALLGRNGELRQMWSLEQMVRDSFGWR